MTTARRVVSAAVAISAALTLTALPASAASPPATLASALAALKAAEAQVRIAISDQATVSARAAQRRSQVARPNGSRAGLKRLLPRRSYVLSWDNANRHGTCAATWAATPR